MTINWAELFEFTVAPMELVVRGSFMYLFLFMVFRTVLKRDVGAVGIADVLLLVLVADAAQNAMADDYRSISDGLVLVSTILGWNALLDWLAFRFPRMRRLLQASELCLVRDGRIIWRNLRREFMSEDELMAKLRQHGISHLGEVRRAYMEADGMVSVIRRDRGETGDPSDGARHAP